MNSQPGRRQYIEQDTTDAIAVRLISDEQTEIVLAGSNTIEIFSRSGGELVASTPVSTISGSVATYSRSWSNATFSRDHGLKAVWALDDGSTTYTRVQYFSVVKRAFRSSLTDADITSLHPYIVQQNQQANLSIYRLESWEEIQRILSARIVKSYAGRRGDLRGSEDSIDRRIDDYPGNFFQPESFRQAHLWLCLSWFFEHNSFGNIDQNQLRADNFRGKALSDLDLALAKVEFDRDDDGILDVHEEGFAFNSIPIER